MNNLYANAEERIRLRCIKCNSIIRTRQAKYLIFKNKETRREWLNITISCQQCGSYFDIDIMDEDIRFKRVEDSHLKLWPPRASSN